MIIELPSALRSISPAGARRIVITVLVIAAIAGAYALALVNRPVPAPLTYAPYRFGLASAAGLPSQSQTSYKQAAHGSATRSQTSLPAHIIRTGDVAVQLKAKTVLGAKQNLLSMLTGFAGSYVASSSTYDHNRYLDLQIEVPASDFSSVVSLLEHRFGKVESESTTTQDVGLQVVNLNARLQNLDAQRLTLLKLFAKSKTVADTIRVQNVLGNVEGQIEQIQGQIKYLDHQINMSSISVEFDAKNAHHGTSNTIFNAFGDAGKGIVGVIAGAIVVVGYAIPLTVLGLALYALALLIFRLARRRRQRSASPAVA